MKKTMTLRIFPDGKVQADINGIKGKKCMDMISVIEEILDANTIDSSYTEEYYESETVKTTEENKQNLFNKCAQ